MDHFNYKEGILHAEAVDLTTLARVHGTPCYVYSRATLERHWRAFDQALQEVEHLVCYAVKANANLAVLNVLAQLGSGFDIVSGGELERVLRAGGVANSIVFSGVGKTTAEIRQALSAGIYCFNIESEMELLRLNQIAENMHCQAPIAVRVNPDVDAQTHPYISTGLKQNKFGVSVNRALQLYQQAQELAGITIKGIACHIGSQLTRLEPLIEAWQRLIVLVEQLQKEHISLQHIDVGGGLGVHYHQETPPEPEAYGQALRQVLAGRPYRVLIEPGRAIAANAGVLLTRVEYLKNTAEKRFAIVDAAMNDLMRPALYQAWQDILPVRPRQDVAPHCYDVVGPICETADFLGKDRMLALREGDLLAIRTCGAYGFTMSSNYNSRPRVTELLVDGAHVHIARRRETIDDLLALEQVL